MHIIVYNKKLINIDWLMLHSNVYQMWSLAAFVAATTYSDEVQATTKNNTVLVWEQHQSE